MWEIRHGMSHAAPVYIDNAKALSWNAMGNNPAPHSSEGHVTVIAESGHWSFCAIHFSTFVTSSRILMTKDASSNISILSKISFQDSDVWKTWNTFLGILRSMVVTRWTCSTLLHGLSSVNEPKWDLRDGSVLRALAALSGSGVWLPESG